VALVPAQAPLACDIMVARIYSPLLETYQHPSNGDSIYPAPEPVKQKPNATTENSSALDGRLNHIKCPKESNPPSHEQTRARD